MKSVIYKSFFMYQKCHASYDIQGNSFSVITLKKGIAGGFPFLFIHYWTLLYRLHKPHRSQE